MPMEVEQSVQKRRHIKVRCRGNTQKKICNRKNKFQVSLCERVLHLLMNSEDADFQFLYIAVALNVVIYFHSYVLHFSSIVGLLSCISNCIGVLTCGQDDETLLFRL